MNWAMFLAAFVWTLTILCGFTMVGSVISASDEGSYRVAARSHILALIMAVVFIVGISVIAGMGWGVHE